MSQINISCPICSNENLKFIYEGASRKFGKKRFFDCNQCGLISVHPEDYPSTEIEQYVYNQHENNPNDNHYIEFLKQAITPLESNLTEFKTALDFGCGPGPAMPKILEPYGITTDLYDPLFYPNDEILKRRYNLVVCTEVIEHLRTPLKVFETLRSLLMNNQSVLTVMTETYSNDINFSEWHYQRDPTHICFYREETFEWIAKDLNLNLSRASKRVSLFQLP